MLKQTVISDSKCVRGKVYDFITEPVIIRVTKFDSASSEKFSTDINKAQDSGQTVIPIVIDSYGGEVYSLLSMISEINNAKLPVVTICEGKAMSCGALLFGFGEQRYMSDDATLMIHDVSSWSVGKVEEIKSSSQQTDLLNTLVFKRLAKQVGQPADYFLDILHDKAHAEWYISAKDAKKHKLATHIGVPSLVTEVSIRHSLCLPQK